MSKAVTVVNNKTNLPAVIEEFKTELSAVKSATDAGITVGVDALKRNVELLGKGLEKLTEKGCPKVVVCDLARSDMAEAVEDAFRYSKLIVASSSYNAGLFPPMEHFLKYLKERNYQNRTVGIIENGSWAPSAGKCMKDTLQSMKNINIIEPVITVKSTMNDENIAQMEQMANDILETF